MYYGSRCKGSHTGSQCGPVPGNEGGDAGSQQGGPERIRQLSAVSRGSLLQPEPGTSFPRDNRHVLMMSTWVNESCLFHLVNTLPFSAIPNRHAGPGALRMAGEERNGRSWGRVGGLASVVGQSLESQVGGRSGLPLGSSAERSFSKHVFSRVASEPHRQKGPSRDASIFFPHRLPPWERHREVTLQVDSGTLRKATHRSKFPSQVTWPKVGTEGREPRGMFNFLGTFSNSAGSLRLP